MRGPNVDTTHSAGANRLLPLRARGGPLVQPSRDRLGRHLHLARPRSVATGLQLPPGCNSRNLLSPKSLHASRTPPSRLSALFGSDPTAGLSPRSLRAFPTPPRITVWSLSADQLSPTSLRACPHLRSSRRHHLLRSQLSPTSLRASLSPPVTPIPCTSQRLLSPRSRRASPAPLRFEDVCACLSGSAPRRSTHRQPPPLISTRQTGSPPECPARSVTHAVPTHPDVSPSERGGTQAQLVERRIYGGLSSGNSSRFPYSDLIASRKQCCQE